LANAQKSHANNLATVVCSYMIWKERVDYNIRKKTNKYIFGLSWNY